VLRKCANPVCATQFRYLHQGRLFEVEMQCQENPSADGGSKPGSAKIHVERLWLCDQCARQTSLRFDRREGLVMMNSASQEATIAFARPNGNIISRVLIRPLDLDLKVKRYLSGVKVLKAEAA